MARNIAITAGGIGCQRSQAQRLLNGWEIHKVIIACQEETLGNDKMLLLRRQCGLVLSKRAAVYIVCDF
jgi:hypothetical protein